MALNEKHQRFVDEYIIDMNATQAAIRAGYSEASARTTSSRLLANANIKAAIEERLSEKTDDVIMSQNQILSKLTAIANGEVREEVLRGEGQGFQVIDNMAVSAKDQMKALELLGKYWSMWTDKVEHSGNVELELAIDYGGDDDGDSTEEES